MKKIIFLAFVILQLLSVTRVKAQQLPMYSQYMWNDYIINPAFTGATDVSPIQVTYRKQWMGFNGSPETFTFGGHTGIGKSMGFGGMLFKDEAGGAYAQTGGLLNYAYRIQLSENSNLAFGISAQLNQYSFNANKISALNTADVALQAGAQNSLTPDASFGMLYQYKPRLKIGIAVHQLLQSKLEKLNLAEFETNQLVRHYNLLTSYTFTLNERISVEPTFLLKATDATPVQLEVGARVELNSLWWLGIAIRQQDAVVAILGVEYKNMFLGYSYDATLSDIRFYSSGSSELVLAYKFMRKKAAKSLKKDDSKLPPWYLRKLKEIPFK